MAETPTIPVQVTREADGRIEELGLREPFTQMIEHLLTTVSDLQALDVVRYDDPDEPGQPRLVITAWRPGPGSGDDPTYDQWVYWFVRTFPPHVCRWFGFDVAYRKHHVR